MAYWFLINLGLFALSLYAARKLYTPPSVTAPRPQGIALPTVQKLVSILGKAGLLRSARGLGGGIQLARPAAAITLADIIEAVEGPIAMTGCINEATCHCAIEPDCNVKPHWQHVNAAVKGALSQVSLSTLAAGR